MPRTTVMTAPTMIRMTVVDSFGIFFFFDLPGATVTAKTELTVGKNDTFVKRDFSKTY